MGQRRVHGSVVNIKQLSRFKMNRIILIFAFFGSAVLCEEVARKPKLFFVSTSATTSTLQTASICYVTSNTITTCAGRKKRRTISLDGMEPEGAVQPSTFKREVEGESVKQDEVSSKVNVNREGDSSSIGSPPPPSPHPPPSQSPTQCQACCAHRSVQTNVDKFEPKNHKYFPPCSICLTDMFLLPFISIHVLTFNSTNMCTENIETGSFNLEKKKKKKKS